MKIFALITCTAIFSASIALSQPVQKKRQNQYDKVLSSLCKYVNDQFKDVKQIRILKGNYLPENVDSYYRKFGIRIVYLDIEDKAIRNYAGMYVLNMLEMQRDSGLNKIGVVCHKLSVEQDRIALANTGGINYWFKETNGKFFFVKSGGCLPADFK